jgi:hypothetical protein
MKFLQSFSFTLPIYSKYLLRLLNENRLNEFHLITHPNKTYKTYHIKFDNIVKLKNCTQGLFGINLENLNYSFRILYYLNFTELIDKNKIEKTSFVLNKLEFTHSVKFHLSYSHPISRINFFCLFLFCFLFELGIYFYEFSQITEQWNK